MAELKIKADSGGGTVSFKGPSSTTSNAAVQLTLPVDDGAANTWLKSNGSGVTSWAAPTATEIATSSGTAGSGTFLRGDNTWAAAGGGKVLQWNVYTNSTRTELTKTTSGNTNRVNLWSVSFNKTVASSTIAWFGHIPTHDDHSAALQMVTDYGGTEIPGGWSFTYTPTGWTGTKNLSGYIAGHTTTGAQNLIFKYYSQNQGADNAPAVWINPSSTDENRHNQTQSMLTVLELGA